MNQRKQIRMSDQEVAAFLAQGFTLSVATISTSGYPDLVAMWYTLIDGKIAFWTYSKSQKTMNLRRDPRLTCLVETGTHYAELRGVEIKGIATLIDDRTMVQAVGEAIHQRYARGALDTDEKLRIERQAQKRIAVLVHPVTTISWDHSKLGGKR